MLKREKDPMSHSRDHILRDQQISPIHPSAAHVKNDYKKGYQPMRNDPPPQTGSLGPNPANKKTQNMWQVVDDGFGSSRDISNVSGLNAMPSEGVHLGSGGKQENQVTMKREFQQ